MGLRDCVLLVLCVWAACVQPSVPSCQLLSYEGDTEGRCSCRDASVGAVVSLAKLSALALGIKTSAGNYTYTYHPCSGIDVLGYQALSVIQQDMRTASYYNLGNASSVSAVMDSDGLLFVYRGENCDGILRTSLVRLICDVRKTVPILTFETQTTDAHLDAHQVIDYKFNLTSDACCFVMPGPGNLSTGSILLIVFFVMLTLYFSGGLLYTRYRTGSEGIEMIPNLAFWKDLPFLVKDGACFVVQCCRQRSLRTYDSI